MSGAIDVARRANEAFSATPFGELKKLVLDSESFEGSRAKAERLGYGDLFASIDPEIEVLAGGLPGAASLPVGKGPEIWLSYWREWLEPWETLEFEPVEYEHLGDWVIVEADVTATGEMSGVPVELKVWQIWKVRDGSAVRYGVFEARDPALAAIEADDGAER